MSLGKRKRKSEHAGAKNGGGHWGTRAEAKRISKKVRRSNDKIEASGWKIGPNAEPYFGRQKVKTTLIRLHGNAPFDRGAKVRWLLDEMKVRYEDRWLDVKKKDIESPAYLKLNPMGRVPVAEIDDLVLFESGAICAYLSDLHLDKGMAPALNAPERGEYQKWMYFASATIDALQWQYELIEDIPPGTIKNKKMKALQGALRDALEAVDQALAKGSFLAGNRFSTADICVSYQLYWLRFGPEFKSVMDTFPRVEAYIDRMFARPAAKTAEWPRPHV